MTETEVCDFVPQFPMTPCKAVGQAPAAAVPMVPDEAVGQPPVAAVPMVSDKAVGQPPAVAVPMVPDKAVGQPRRWRSPRIPVRRSPAAWRTISLIVVCHLFFPLLIGF